MSEEGRTIGYRELSTKVRECESLQRIFDQIEKVEDNGSWSLRVVFVGGGRTITYKAKDETSHLLELLDEKRRILIDELEEMGIVRDKEKR